MGIYYKFLDKKFTGGNAPWSWEEFLPIGSNPGKWTPHLKGVLFPCHYGYHLIKAEQLLSGYALDTLYEAEILYKPLDTVGKTVARRVRLLRKVETWNEHNIRGIINGWVRDVLMAEITNPYSVIDVRPLLEMADEIEHRRQSADYGGGWAKLIAVEMERWNESLRLSPLAGAMMMRRYTWMVRGLVSAGFPIALTRATDALVDYFTVTSPGGSLREATEYGTEFMCERDKLSKKLGELVGIYPPRQGTEAGPRQGTEAVGEVSNG